VAQTVARRLDRMRDDLALLVNACNRDGLHDVASRAQAALELVASIDPSEFIPELATWPPKVTKGEDNETHWRVSP
jgi:hypothetical protein